MPDYDLTADLLLDDDFMAALTSRLNRIADWEVEGVTRPKVRREVRLDKGPAPIGEDRHPPSEQPWREQGLCQHVEGDWFDIPGGGEKRQRKEMELELATCQACEVLEECREYALETRQPFGIWGGLLPRERVKARRRK